MYKEQEPQEELNLEEQRDMIANITMLLYKQGAITESELSKVKTILYQ